MGQPKKRNVDPTIIERAEARARGFPRYYTSRVCKSGHVAERLVSNASCLDCMLESNARAREKDPERFKAYSRDTGARFLANNPDYTKTQYGLHKEKIKARTLAHQRDNPEMARARRLRWKRKNAEWCAGWSAKRRQTLRRQTHAWLTPDQIAEIDAIYFEAANKDGGPWHVDHIVPINGVSVCGLHVPWNLQILLAVENMQKGNRF